ncbi:MAG: hypothetical protein IT393_07155 [Nitrospirae bacterium]|nr:hypothetical protein [Nitrospirota bacterium]
MYALIYSNTDIVAVSDDKNKLLQYRDSLPLVEKMMYVVAEKKEGYWEKIRG